MMMKSYNKKVLTQLLLRCTILAIVVTASLILVEACSAAAVAAAADGNCAAVDDAATPDKQLMNEDNNENNNDEAEVWCDECDADALYEELDCKDFDSIEKPVPTLEEYMILRRTYEDVVGKEKSTISPVSEEHGFLIPYRAGQAEGTKGRGIFAVEFIPKGTPVLNFRQEATFYDGKSVRQFLSKIPSTLACDYLSWSYTRWDYHYKGYTQTVDLDDSTLCNDSIQEDTQNIGCDVQASLWHEGGSSDENKEACEKHYYAIQDIQPGEELLCLYSTFVGDAYGSGEGTVEDENVGATALGLGWNNANPNYF